MKEKSDLLLFPNLLTLLRIFLIVPVLSCFHFQFWIWGLFLAILLFLTDFFDGYFARRLNQTSVIGSILDPIADKLVVIFLFLFLYLKGAAPAFYVGIVFLRDILQLSVIPVLMVWKKIPFFVKPKMIPKWGTTLNYILLLYYFWIHIGKSITSLATFTLFINVIEIPILIISSIIEVYILITFLPRYYQIYNRLHDTFE
ncbi:MAG: CDP-alcohol phosphatidyltransferase family protein [Leptospira sp.]|nr:CDP-alcohol phosphatidyltransferase family protein [Leptospira sp.]